MTSFRPSAVSMVALRLEPVWMALLVVGAYGGGFGWRGGAFLMLAAVCGRIAGHLAIALAEYPRAMRRPWPAVAPLEDDDW